MSTATTTPVRSASDPAVRSTMIGGSDAAKVMGLSPWEGGTPLDLYLEKLGLTERGEMSEPAEWGLILEHVILQQYAARSGHVIVGRDENGDVMRFHPNAWYESVMHDDPVDRFFETLRHRKHDFIGCHLDGLVIGNEGYRHGEVIALVQAKTAGTWVAEKWNLDDELSDEIPDEYIAQCQHEAMVFESITGEALPVMVPTLVGGQKFRVFQVDPNKDLQAKILEAELEFWGRIVRRHAPEPMDTEAGKKALGIFYPEHKPESELTVDGRHKYAVLADDLHDAREAFEEAETAKTAAENAVKDRMGDLATLIGPGFKVTWKKSKDGEVTDHEAAFIELSTMAGLRGITPDEVKEVRQKHTKTKPGTRRFLPKFF